MGDPETENIFWVPRSTTCTMQRQFRLQGTLAASPSELLLYCGIGERPTHRALKYRLFRIFLTSGRARSGHSFFV